MIHLTVVWTVDGDYLLMSVNMPVTSFRRLLRDNLKEGLNLFKGDVASPLWRV